jgi:uncharacterized OsmC-like protein
MNSIQTSSAVHTVTQLAMTPDTQFTNVSMADRHKPLIDLYQREPARAMIPDSATTSSDAVVANDPLHAVVSTAGHDIGIGVHPAVGGDGDGPVPGELLAAALASCLDSTLRIIANRLDIKLIRLSVTATGEVDVRGTLMVSSDVPVGFQHFQLAVDIEAEPDTAPAMLKALLNAAEASCVVMQTLRNGVDVSTDVRMG